MDIIDLQNFFFWCMVVNFGIHIFTSIAVLRFRNLLYKVYEKMFGLDKETTNKTLVKYLATYKLFITVFNFVPWIAILIIK